MASTLLYWHWEAMLVSYLATRKTVLPFHTLSEMYENTDFRLALIPSTSFEDSFKYSADPLWQKIYKERLQPYLQEYSDYPDHLSDMVNFLRNDYKTALYDGVIVLRYIFLIKIFCTRHLKKIFHRSSKEYRDCLIVETKGRYFTQPYAWAFPKHSPYLDVFNFYISQVIEKGQWNAIIAKVIY